MKSKEKLKLIKEYKEKSIFNLYNIVKNIFEVKHDLKLNIETLSNFLLIDNYKKYFNILKSLIEEERNLSGITNNVGVKDGEIIKYIHRMFSDEFSSYYIKPKKEINTYENMVTFQANLTNLINESKKNVRPSLNLLSHRRYLALNKARNEVKKKQASKPIINIKKEEIINAKNKTSVKKMKNEKTLKLFLKEDNDEEQKKREFLYKKMHLTNELKYQMKIIKDEEGKGRLQNLLDQIEALKNDDIKEYIKLLHEKYENFRKEVKKLTKDKEQEERINSFLNDLIYDRNNITELKRIYKKQFFIEDYKI